MPPPSAPLTFNAVVRINSSALGKLLACPNVMARSRWMIRRSSVRDCIGVSLVIGIAYKKDIGDHRESPSFKLLELLIEKGARVEYHDTFIPVIGRTREYMDFAGMESVDLTPERVASYDAVLIATDHSDVDYDSLVEHAALVVDTRNATRDITYHRDKIVKA